MLFDRNCRDKLNIVGNNPHGILQRLCDIVSLIGNLPPLVPVFQNLYHAIFVAAASQLIKMTSANFGAYDRQKFTISVFVTFNSVGTVQKIVQKGKGSDRGLTLHQNAGFGLVFLGSTNGTSWDVNLTTFDTYSAGVERHFKLDYDSANAIVSDRVRLTVDGTRVTTFTTETYPTLNASIFDSAGDIEWGGLTSASQYLNGLLDEAAITSGTNPAASSFRDTVTGKAKDLTGLSGLWSWMRAENNWFDTVLKIFWIPVNVPTFGSNP